jgi:hypothetical protein
MFGFGAMTVQCGDELRPCAGTLYVESLPSRTRVCINGLLMIGTSEVFTPSVHHATLLTVWES